MRKIRRWFIDRSPRGGDRGDIGVLVLVMAAVIAAVLMLIVDGGARIQAATRADTYASEAARAASAAAGPAGAEDTAAAVIAAQAYLGSADAAGSVTVTGPGQVTVTVSVTAAGPITGIEFTVTRIRTAQLQVGIDTGETP